MLLYNTFLMSSFESRVVFPEFVNLFLKFRYSRITISQNLLQKSCCKNAVHVMTLLSMSFSWRILYLNISHGFLRSLVSVGGISHVLRSVVVRLICDGK